MAGFNDFTDTAWGMTEFDGMCSMPVAAEGVYANYTETSEPKGMMNMDSDVDYYTAVEPLTPHFHEPIGQMHDMEPMPHSFVQPNAWAPVERSASDDWAPRAPLVVFEHRPAPTNNSPFACCMLKTELGLRMDYQQEHALWGASQAPARPPAYMQGPYHAEEDMVPHAPTQEHASMMPAGVLDEDAEEASAAPSYNTMPSYNTIVFDAPAPRLPAQPRHAALPKHRPGERRRKDDISEEFTEASLQEALRRLSPQCPAASPPPPRASASPERSKRGRAHLDFALLHKGAPVGSSKNLTTPSPKLLPAAAPAAPTAAPLSPAKPTPGSAPKRRKLATPQVPAARRATAPWLSAAASGAAAAPASVRQALGAAAASSSASGAVLLSTCKFVSKGTRVKCPEVPRVATHKRGYLACACSAGHQWVWGRGCDTAAHWFERDAFDTGRRNHMNRHQEK
ncbi:hypothetical protein T484DRAFT_1834199 [Baffinella frigidus]|nr:hypothetical protein T484DRAFT_1834199 [Cryptophyta sp. CCMP2293]